MPVLVNAMYTYRTSLRINLLSLSFTVSINTHTTTLLLIIFRCFHNIHKVSVNYSMIQLALLIPLKSLRHVLLKSPHATATERGPTMDTETWIWIIYQIPLFRTFGITSNRGEHSLTANPSACVSFTYSPVYEAGFLFIHFSSASPQPVPPTSPLQLLRK